MTRCTSRTRRCAPSSWASCRWRNARRCAGHTTFRAQHNAGWGGGSMRCTLMTVQCGRNPLSNSNTLMLWEHLPRQMLTRMRHSARTGGPAVRLDVRPHPGGGRRQEDSAAQRADALRHAAAGDVPRQLLRYCSDASLTPIDHTSSHTCLSCIGQIFRSCCRGGPLPRLGQAYLAVTSVANST